jgi:acyl carrier protein
MRSDEKELRDAMATAFEVDPSTIDESTSIDTVGEWDSLKHLTLVLVLEETFNVSFTEEQTVEMLSYPLIKTVLAEHGIRFA